ncbi:MAG: T9SS type A sorting domain-containing protein [Saprospiraceae bacterium]
MITDDNINNYRIYNTLGQVIDNKSVNNQREVSISTSSINNGIYFIEVKTDSNNRIVKKIEVIK